MSKKSSKNKLRKKIWGIKKHKKVKKNFGNKKTQKSEKKR